MSSEGNGAPGQQPVGSIVVATCNRAHRLDDTLAKLLAMPDGWPIIVIDDASTDDTVERIRSQYGDRVRLISLPDNRGAAARNVGVEVADTPFVAFADDDSWWAPGSLARAAEVMTRHPEIGLVAASVIVEPEGFHDPIVEQFASSPLPPSAAGINVLGFLACAAVVRRSAFLVAGGFHPLLHIGGEEELLAIDLRRRGWSLVHIPTCVAHHEPDHQDAGRTERPVRLLRNHALVGVMRRRRPACWDGMRSLGRRARHDPTARRALAAALRCLPTAIAARRPIPDQLEADLRLVADSDGPEPSGH